MTDFLTICPYTRDHVDKKTNTWGIKDGVETIF